MVRWLVDTEERLHLQRLDIPESRWITYEDSSKAFQRLSVRT